MRSFIKKYSKLLATIGIGILGVAIIALSYQLVSFLAFGQEKESYEEPEQRSGDYSPEQEWLKKHSESKDEIDKAILNSLRQIENDSDYPSFYSSGSPNNSEGIRDAMHKLSPSVYPELWKRVCTEPAYRIQKMVALKSFLGIDTPWNFADHNAQEFWYNDFSTLKKEFKTIHFDTVTEEDAKRFGNLLLPALREKAEKKTMTSSEMKVASDLINQLEAYMNPEKPQTVSQNEKAVKDWFQDNKDIVKSILDIIEKDYKWVK